MPSSAVSAARFGMASPTRRRVLVLAGLFGLLGVMLLLTPSGQERLPPMTIYSSAPNGGRAFWLWLDELGYDVVTIESTPYAVPNRATTLLALSPTQTVSQEAVDTIEGWVRAGGTLIVASDGLAARLLLPRFGIGLRAAPPGVASAEPLTPGALDPAIGEVMTRATDVLTLSAESATPLLGRDGQLIAARVDAGLGRVIALSAPHALSNQALRNESNARLALSLIGPSSRGRVAFDELHHGYGVRQQRSLFNVLLDQGWGRAVLLAGVLVFVYLILSGRRFGRSRPLTITRGRSRSEYVTSLAALYRAGGQHAFISDHFRQRLRRDLAQRVGLAGDATEAQIEARLRARGREPEPSLRLLRQLGQSRILSERALMALIRDSNDVMLSPGHTDTKVTGLLE